MTEHEQFMQAAIELSLLGPTENKGGPFGAVVVKDGKIIGRGSNQVTSALDPTAHAEVVAIRDACKNLNSFQLDGCILYTSCEPCPMCLGAIYWARPDKVYYANTREDAANIGFDDSMIYQELKKDFSERKIPFVQLGRAEALNAFQVWKDKTDKTRY
ncbi:MAG TPA: nucleoside deaminase [Cytophagaceae bacterium]|jgi:tRNA(Arg) A34 adenosine deaminase TadA|nr:nucleoside deaminase [Cytophagaceae bacterium]